MNTLKCLFGFHKYKTIAFWSKGHLGYEGKEFEQNCEHCLKRVFKDEHELSKNDLMLKIKYFSLDELNKKDV